VIDVCVLHTVAGVARYAEQVNLKNPLPHSWRTRDRLGYDRLALLPHWSPPGDRKGFRRRTAVSVSALPCTSLARDTVDTLVAEIRRAFSDSVKPRSIVRLGLC